MAKPRKKLKPEEIETDPGAWDRFKHAVDAAVKSGPKHRTSPKPHKDSIKGSRGTTKKGGGRKDRHQS